MGKRMQFETFFVVNVTFLLQKWIVKFLERRPQEECCVNGYKSGKYVDYFVAV